MFFSCDNNLKVEYTEPFSDEKTIQVEPQKNNLSTSNFESLLNYEFVISCGTGCAMLHKVKQINPLNSEVIQVLFQVEKYENDIITNTFYQTYIYSFGNINTIFLIKDDGTNQNVEEIFQGQALKDFQELGVKLFELKTE